MHLTQNRQASLLYACMHTNRLHICLSVGWCGPRVLACSSTIDRDCRSGVDARFIFEFVVFIVRAVCCASYVILSVASDEEDN